VWSPARLILLSGTGGSGTTTIAAATVRTLHDEGLRAVLIDVDAAGEPSDRATTLVASVAAVLAGWTGADAVEPQTWADLPSVRHLDSWLAIDAARLDAVDAVVVDCGDLRGALDLVAFPMIAQRILERLLTPTVAMRREVGEPSQEAEARGYQRLSDLRDVLTRAVDSLQHDRTTMRLVAAPTADSVSKVLRAAAVLPMLGVDVDGVVLNRVARKADGSRPGVISEHAELLDRLEREVDGPLVWKSSSRVRAVPKGRSALGPLGASRVLRSEGMSAQAHDEEYSLLIPLAGPAAREARVGRLGDDLVVALDGLHRWLPLPSVLRRCLAVEAARSVAGLRVSFVPDGSLWRRTGTDGPEEGAA
jgi:arsenite-transporting ATPase